MIREIKYLVLEVKIYFDQNGLELFCINRLVE